PASTTRRLRTVLRGPPPSFRIRRVRAPFAGRASDGAGVTAVQTATTAASNRARDVSIGRAERAHGRPRSHNEFLSLGAEPRGERPEVGDQRAALAEEAVRGVLVEKAAAGERVHLELEVRELLARGADLRGGLLEAGETLERLALLRRGERAL